MKVENPPAFPSVGEGYGNPLYSTPGLTLRDYFAAAAMQGIMSQLRYQAGEYHILSMAAYDLADAMLAERSMK